MDSISTPCSDEREIMETTDGQVRTRTTTLDNIQQRRFGAREAGVEMNGNWEKYTGSEVHMIRSTHDQKYTGSEVHKINLL